MPDRELLIIKSHDFWDNKDLFLIYLLNCPKSHISMQLLITEDDEHTVQKETAQFIFKTDSWEQIIRIIEANSGAPFYNNLLNVRFINIEKPGKK